MPFFNFHNDQTFHFFNWVKDGGAVDVNAMVARAVAFAGDDQGLAMGRESTEVAHAKLRVWLADLAENITGFLLDGPSGIGMPVNGDPNTLLGPLLHDAVQQIRFDAVAEALMRLKGKWVTEYNPLEIE